MFVHIESDRTLLIVDPAYLLDSME